MLETGIEEVGGSARALEDNESSKVGDILSQQGCRKVQREVFRESEKVEGLDRDLIIYKEGRFLVELLSYYGCTCIKAHDVRS